MRTLQWLFWDRPGSRGRGLCERRRGDTHETAQPSTGTSDKYDVAARRAVGMAIGTVGKSDHCTSGLVRTSGSSGEERRSVIVVEDERSLEPRSIASFIYPATTGPSVRPALSCHSCCMLNSERTPSPAR